MEATTAVQGCSPTAGRRERKKQRTREALIDAAFQLFQEKGFEATTVEEIADAVDVSSRTFFRYFASKEDVVLTFQDEQFATMLEELSARPADEPVMTALRHAAVDVVRACEEGDYGFDPRHFVCIQRLMETSPAVFGRSLEHGQKKQVEVTRVIAERMGVDPATDLRPHVAAGASSCAFRSAFEVLACGATKTERLSDVLAEVFAILEDGLNYPAAWLRPSTSPLVGTPVTGGDDHVLNVVGLVDGGAADLADGLGDAVHPVDVRLAQLTPVRIDRNRPPSSMPPSEMNSFASPRPQKPSSSSWTSTNGVKWSYRIAVWTSWGHSPERRQSDSPTMPIAGSVARSVS